MDTVIKTGNVMADAILNSKLNVAEKMNIKLNVKANVPDKLPMSDVELCSMLGNILDNAVEACGTLPEEERFMRVYIGKLKGQLYLSVQNSAGKVRKSKNTYLSTKEGEHGYGLFRIDRVAKRYGGYVNRQNEEGVFATEGAWSISFTIKFGYVSFEFIGIHYVYCLLQYTGGNVTFIVHLWFAACFPFLCSNQDDTV